MNDLISRKAAIDALKNAENHAFNSFYDGLIKAHRIIEVLPSAEPERKTGHWIITEGEFMHSRKYRCSECGHQFRWIYDQVFPPVFNYCKNCGARMEVDHE